MISRRLISRSIRFLSYHPINALLPPYWGRLASIFLIHRPKSVDSPLSGHSPEQLRSFLNGLKGLGYHFVSMREIIDCVNNGTRLPPNAISFTMDDGYADQARISASIFIESDVPCTIFAITDFIDGKSWPWDAKIRYIFKNAPKRSLEISFMGEALRYDLSTGEKEIVAMRHFREYYKHVPGLYLTELMSGLAKECDVKIPELPPAQFLPLTWDEARQLEKYNIDFAPHTKNHFMLSQLDNVTATEEILGSWERLKQELKNPLPVLAYPTGRICDITARDTATLKQAGLIGAVTTQPGYIQFDNAGSAITKRYFINRFTCPEDSYENFLQYSSKIEYLKTRIRYLLYTLRFKGRWKLLRVICSQVWYRMGGYRSLCRIRWDKVNRLIFVCYGNLCRSPYAEIVATDLRVKSRSFGLAVDPSRRYGANEQAIAVSAGRYVDLRRHITMALEDMDLGENDLILAMEPCQIRELKKRSLPEDCQVSLLGLWADHKTPIIADPYGLSKGYFSYCYDQIDNALLGVIGKMTSSGST